MGVNNGNNWAISVNEVDALMDGTIELYSHKCQILNLITSVNEVIINPVRDISANGVNAGTDHSHERCIIAISLVIAWKQPHYHHYHCCVH